MMKAFIEASHFPDSSASSDACGDNCCQKTGWVLRLAQPLIRQLASFISLCALSAITIPAVAQTAFYYGNQVLESDLGRFKRVVVEAESLSSPVALQKKGAEVFAYVSVGEAEGWRASARALPQALFNGENQEWDSRIVDLTQTRWHAYLLDERMAPLWAAGYRGFFLDTLDSYLRANTTPKAIARQSDALIVLIQKMHSRFPGAKFLLNRGFDVLPVVAPIVDGVVAESLFQRWDQSAKQYVSVPETDRLWLLAKLRETHEIYGLPITVIDYVSPDNPSLARETVQRIRALGFEAWVANPGLDRVYEAMF